MLIVNSKRWTNQPPPGAQINFGHPLCKGLTFYTLYNAGGGLQKALLPAGLPETTVGSVPAPNWSSDQGGTSHIWDGNWSSWYERGIWVEPPTNVTCVVRAKRVGSNGQFGSPINKTYKNLTNPFSSYDIEYNPSGSTQDQARVTVATGGTQQAGTNVSLPSTLNEHTIGLSYTSGALNLWFNGHLKQSDNKTGTLTYDTGNTSRLIISGGSSAAATNPFHGRIYYGAVWNRVLTVAEQEWLHIEPYALLVQKKQIKYFIPASPTRTYSYWITLERLS